MAYIVDIEDAEEHLVARPAEEQLNLEEFYLPNEIEDSGEYDSDDDVVSDAVICEGDLTILAFLKAAGAVDTYGDDLLECRKVSSKKYHQADEGEIEEKPRPKPTNASQQLFVLPASNRKRPTTTSLEFKKDSKDDGRGHEEPVSKRFKQTTTDTECKEVSDQEISERDKLLKQITIDTECNEWSDQEIAEWDKWTESTRLEIEEHLKLDYKIQSQVFRSTGCTFVGNFDDWKKARCGGEDSIDKLDRLHEAAKIALQDIHPDKLWLLSNIHDDAIDAECEKMHRRSKAIVANANLHSS